MTMQTVSIDNDSALRLIGLLELAASTASNSGNASVEQMYLTASTSLVKDMQVDLWPTVSGHVPDNIFDM